MASGLYPSGIKHIPPRLHRRGFLWYGVNLEESGVVYQKRRVWLSLCYAFLVFLVPWERADGSTPNKPIVAVANYPLKYFAERIAGDTVRVTFPIPSGGDPAFWNPDPNGVLAFQSADLILLNGATYSKWLDKVTLSRGKMVNTSRAFKDQYIAEKDSTTHSHGPEGAHAHAGLAFTTWIDFQQAIQQAEAVRRAMERLAPEHKAYFDNNFSVLKKDLLALDRRIEEIVGSRRAPPLLASHPVYDYFARRYGLNIRSMLWELGELPRAEQWAELETILNDHPTKWMIWEGDPHPEAVARLRSLGVGSLVFDPAGNLPDEGDFLSIMRRNIENIGVAFQASH